MLPAQMPDASLLDALRAPGHVVLMRHALAPGSLDPSGFKLNNCTTQRNLGGQGRTQARRAGDALREAGIVVSAAYSGR